MGIDDLIARLERDADARVAAIDARARAEVQTIRDAAKEASVLASHRALAARRTARRARLAEEIAVAKRQARAVRLVAEHSLLEQVMARAAALLDGADRDAVYLSSLRERIAGALRYMEGAAVAVRCRPALVPAVRAALEGRRDVTVLPVATMAAGFTAVARDGTVEVDDTLPARLARMRPRLLIRLFAEVGA